MSRVQITRHRTGSLGLKKTTHKGQLARKALAHEIKAFRRNRPIGHYGHPTLSEASRATGSLARNLNRLRKG